MSLEVIYYVEYEINQENLLNEKVCTNRLLDGKLCLKLI